MRIAQVAPLFEDVPPVGYGGTERVIAGLCDSLSAAGHDVTLFATATSQTDANLEAMVGQPLRVRGERRGVRHRHSHLDLLSLPFSGLAGTPLVVTLHGRVDITEVQRILPMYPDVAFVSISDHQRLPLEGLPIQWAATVPNGLDLDAYLCDVVESLPVDDVTESLPVDDVTSRCPSPSPPTDDPNPPSRTVAAHPAAVRCVSRVGQPEERHRGRRGAGTSGNRTDRQGRFGRPCQRFDRAAAPVRRIGSTH
jgi:hypothetical protein